VFDILGEVESTTDTDNPEEGGGHTRSKRYTDYTNVWGRDKFVCRISEGDIKFL
jgi:hypothetical protein